MCTLLTRETCVCLVACYHLPHISLQVSYTYLFFTNLFTSLYTVYINVVKKSTNLNIFGMMYYNTVTTLPFLLLMAWLSGDLSEAWHFPYSRDAFFQINFQASIFIAFLMNVSTFYCTTLNSARTQTVVGQLKNFVAFLLGLILFDDYIYDHINFVGLIIGFIGGIQYSYVQYQEKQVADAAKAKTLALSNGSEDGTTPLSSVAIMVGGATAVKPPSRSSSPGASDDLSASETGAGAAAQSKKFDGEVPLQAGGKGPSRTGSPTRGGGGHYREGASNDHVVDPERVNLRGRHVDPLASNAAKAL